MTCSSFLLLPRHHITTLLPPLPSAPPTPACLPACCPYTTSPTSPFPAQPPIHCQGLNRATGHLALTRWDAAQPAYVDNLVLLTQEEADAHDALFAPGGWGWP